MSFLPDVDVADVDKPLHILRKLCEKPRLLFTPDLLSQTRSREKHGLSLRLSLIQAIESTAVYRLIHRKPPR
jgi:hypothetical protein